MSQQGAESANAWFQDPQNNGLRFSYDRLRDQLVYENGARVPRPPSLSPQNIRPINTPPMHRHSAPTAPPSLRYGVPPMPDPTSGYATSTSHLKYHTQAQDANLPVTLQSSRSSWSQAGKDVPTGSPADDVFGNFGYLSLGGLSLANSRDGVVRRTRQTPYGQITDVYNQSTGVMDSIQTEPKERITDQDLYQQGVQAHRMLQETPNDSETLDSSFKRPAKPKKFFTEGKVFLICWAEPAADSAQTSISAGTVATSIEISRNRFNEPVFSKVRRFVVIREGEFFCTALPVMTYNGKGVGKKGVKKSDHAIIFTGKEPPQPHSSEAPQRNEMGMRQGAIRVDVDHKGEKLDPMSRIDFGKVHTIHHNLKVRSFGMVNRDSMANLVYQFQAVWTNGFGKYALEPWKATSSRPADNRPASVIPSPRRMREDAYNALVGMGYTREQAAEFLEKRTSRRPKERSVAFGKKLEDIDSSGAEDGAEDEDEPYQPSMDDSALGKRVV